MMSLCDYPNLYLSQVEVMTSYLSIEIVPDVPPWPPHGEIGRSTMN